MTKEKITFEQIVNLDLPNLIIIATPIMIFLVALEWLFSYKDKKDYYDGKDTLTATFIGLVNAGMSAAIKVVTFGIILFFYNLVPWAIPHTWWSYISVYFGWIFGDMWHIESPMKTGFGGQPM